ncbi:MAG: OadG family protein [Porticoccaceae bacterium]|nr:OadG family protein [Porticoccaceae bacterium]
MEATLIAQGTDLMLYGMGTVFTFLTLLVGITSLMSSVVNRLAPEETEVVSASTAAVQGSVEPRIVKAIQAALDQHRSQ